LQSRIVKQQITICSPELEKTEQWNLTPLIFGRKWHLERMAQSEIKLPVTSGGEPDWHFIANYIKTLSFSSQI